MLAFFLLAVLVGPSIPTKYEENVHSLTLRYQSTQARRVIRTQRHSQTHIHKQTNRHTKIDTHKHAWHSEIHQDTQKGTEIHKEMYTIIYLSSSSVLSVLLVLLISLLVLRPPCFSPSLPHFCNYCGNHYLSASSSLINPKGSLPLPTTNIVLCF